MDWLFHNPVADLGPFPFLALYACFAAAVVVASRAQVSAADPNDPAGLPVVGGDRDPSEVAYLRGGGNELLRFTVFDLLRRALLRVVPNARPKRASETIERVPDAVTPPGTSTLEDAVLAFYAEPRTTQALFASPLPAAAAAYGAAVYEPHLRSEGLYAGSDVRATAARVRLYGGLALAGLAGYRLAEAAALHHFNVGFLIVLAIFAILALLIATRAPRLSARGRALLGRLRTAYRPASLSPAAVGAGAAALPIFVAASGLGALAGTEFAPVNTMFRRQAAANGGIGGCSGGCGSSGGSGGSCGGGGGCGGGCGG